MTGIFQKLSWAFLSLLGVIILVFILFQFFGDPVKLTVGQSGDKKTVEQIRHQLHLDAPKWKQLLLYLNDISPIAIHDSYEIQEKKLNGLFIGGHQKIGFKIPYLGTSYQTKKPVTSMIAKAIPGTIILALCAMALACIFGIALGILASVYKGSWLDKTIIFISTIGISTPSFFAALGIAFLFGIVWHDYTGLSFTGNWYEIDAIIGTRHLAFKNWILPSVTLGFRPLAMITQITRSAMLDQLSMDYIRTAQAKGLAPFHVIGKHAFKNTLQPVMTAVSGWLGELLAGAFFIEFIFGWSGLGKLTIDSLEKLDYPVLMGSVITSSLIFILIHWMSDYYNRNNNIISTR